MSKIVKRSWLISGVLVTSVAAAGVFLSRGPFGAPTHGKTLAHVAHEPVTSTEQVGFAPLVVQGSTLPVVPALTWDMRSRAGKFPQRMSGDFGHLANIALRKPGVRIARASTGERAERTVRLSGQPSTELPPPGLLGGARLAAEMKGHRRQVDRCAGKGLVPGGTVSPPAGKLSLSWVVGSDGSSGDLKVLANTLDDASLSKCILDAVGRWKFTPPTDGVAPVQSTFMFL